MTPKQFCEKYLENYTINHDDTIDVDGDVFLDNILGNMEKLPVKFGKVSGWFNCNDNNLTTLDGSPNYVGGEFDCYNNNIMTLEGCPRYVGDFFRCSHNNLTTLEYCPKYIGGNFFNDILTHHILGSVQGNIYYDVKQRFVI
jgi:hypothetical protein